MLSGRREAELTYAGASLDFPGEAVVLVDIGGGVLNSPFARRKVGWSV